MSTYLYWRATPKEEPKHYMLSSNLKTILARRLWDNDGSVWCEMITLGKNMLPYLGGLHDAGVEDAGNLIEYINKHDSVDIWIGE